MPSSPLPNLDGSDQSAYVASVRAYYDRTLQAYLEDVGTSFQAGLLRTEGAEGLPLNVASNLYLAAQAGIRPGDRVLDAGCGVCGPSLDIASHIPNLSIDALTLSPAQHERATQRIAEAGLTGQLCVHLHDYHDLPFPSESFDVALFFESAGYSYNRYKLFSEVYRVLRPGGVIFLKDVFRREGELSEVEQRALAIMDASYVYRTETLHHTTTMLTAIGFESIESHDLTPLIDPDHLPNSFYRETDGRPTLTEFARLHWRFLTLPTTPPALYATVRGVKQAQDDAAPQTG